MMMIIIEVIHDDDNYHRSLNVDLVDDICTALLMRRVEPMILTAMLWL